MNKLSFILENYLFDNFSMSYQEFIEYQKNIMTSLYYIYPNNLTTIDGINFISPLPWSDKIKLSKAFIILA